MEGLENCADCLGGDLDRAEPNIEDEHEDGEMSKRLENAPELENEFNGEEGLEGGEVDVGAVKGKKEKKGRRGKKKGKKAMQDEVVDEEIPAVVEEEVEEEAPKTKKPRKSNGTAKKRKRSKVEEEVVGAPEEEEDAAIEQQLGVATSASNGTSKKRKRKTVESEVLEAPEDVPATLEEEETLEQSLKKARLAKSKTKATKTKKSRKSAPAEEEAEEFDDDHHPFSLTADISKLPAKLEKAKRKLRKSQEVYDIPHDENDAVAVLHQPLTPAHVHHRHDSNSQEEVEVQLQRDVQSATPLEVEDASPKKPSKKALGKRKASEPLVAYDRKQKRVKDKAAGTPPITSFGFTPANKLPPSVVIPLSSAPATIRRATPAFTPINKPRAPSLPRHEPEPEPEQDSDLESDFRPEPEPEEEVEPEPEVPKSSGKKKRRLPTGEENGKTPSKKGGKSKTPKALTPRSTPISTSKGRLPSDDIDAITTAVEEYRDVNDMTQVEINSLVQKDAIKDGSELWKYVYEQVPGIPRHKILNFCRRTFHNFERGGWTEEQDQELREVYERYPGKWKQIGETINRFGEDCRDRWRNYLVNGDNLKKSYWEKDEEKKLRAAVRECIKKVREDRRKNEDPRDAHKTDEELIDWGTVSKTMGHTRSRLQCANKWKKLQDREASDVEDPVAVVPVSETSWRVVEAERAARIMSADEKLQLLYAIRDSGAGREGKIPWKHIQKANTQFKGKKMMLRICFRELRQHITDHEDLKFKELVETLIDAFEAAAPNEPKGFEKFGAAHKISLREKVGYKPRKKKGPDGKYLEEEGNGEGPSSPKKKRKPKKPKISEDYVVEEDEEDVNGEAPSTSKSIKSVVPMDSSPLEPAITTDENPSKKRKKRKLRDRMKDREISQSSAEDNQQPEAEISDLEASLATLSNGKSKKNKRRQPTSEVRVDESEKEEKPSQLIDPPQADEDEMDIDQDENYTAPGGPEEEEKEDAEEDNALEHERETYADEPSAIDEEEVEEDNVFDSEPEAGVEDASEIYEEEEAEEDNVLDPEPEAAADEPSEIEEEEEEAEEDNVFEPEPEPNPEPEPEATAEEPSDIDEEEEDLNTTHHDVESIDLDSGSSRDHPTTTNGLPEESDSDNESVDREFHRAKSLTPDDYRTEKLGSPFSFQNRDQSHANGFANGDGDDSGDDSSDSDSSASIPAVVRRKRMASEEL
jgi:hypothetical protein